MYYIRLGMFQCVCLFIFFVSLQTVATILIFITDVNDEDPVFDNKLYQITLPEVILTHNRRTEEILIGVFIILNFI